MVRKGQAAMEYLMTYGWAILVIVIVLAALLYLGVFNLGSKVPDQCRFKVGMTCTDAKMTPTGLTIQLQNTGGSKMTICRLFCANSDQENILAGHPEAYTVETCNGLAARTEIASGQQKAVSALAADSSNCFASVGTNGDLPTITQYAAGERIRGKLYMWFTQTGDVDTDHVRVATADFQTTVQP
jgi:hypothetical protein